MLRKNFSDFGDFAPESTRGSVPDLVGAPPPDSHDIPTDYLCIRWVNLMQWISPIVCRLFNISNV